MVFFLIALILIVFNNLEFAPEGNFFQSEYMDKNTTTSINGIFVILIVFSHYAQYANFEGIYDAPYLALREHLNQMVVATFLFYSGYGMMESLKKKGVLYLNKIPKKFITLLVKFDLAVCLFWLLGEILNLQYDYGFKSIVLSFTGWWSIGNSNWYIFVILVQYFLMWISFQGLRYTKKGVAYYLGILLFLALTIGFVFFMMKQGKGMYWYNTAILLPIGMVYSLIKNILEKIVMKNDAFFFLWCMLCSGMYVVLYFHRFKYGIEGYTLWACSFISLVLLTTMKIKIGNPVLEWFGKHIFSVYILQRIPMMILDYCGCIDSHRYMSLIIAIVTTALMAIIFEYATDKIIAAPKALLKKNG